MGPLKGNPPVCSLNQHCSQWARIYLKYCLCSVKDGVSLTLGLVSVVSWGVAEVPQIITNYKEKSTEGLSVAFLMTWIIGDLFNLIGCLLEPATLPTQFYMALLYTATTVILTAQTIYYSHIYHRLKANKISLHCKGHKVHQETVTNENQTGCSIDENASKARDDQANGTSVAQEGLHLPSSPIPVSASAIPRYGSYGKDLYYMSARSLSKSPMPIAGSVLVHSRDSGRTPPIHDSAREPLLGRLAPTQSAPPLNTKNMLCVVSLAAFVLCSFRLHLSINSTFDGSPHGVVIQVGRKLLQLQDKAFDSPVKQGGGSSGIGSFLGWAMTAIYLGGRLPQICLNIRRGNVEGLNPLMFVFAVVGNTTYVASILVNSMDWSRIRPNLPWLVDAGGCVLLDVFILTQFVYFRYRRSKDAQNNHDRSTPA